jgi:hypothetical protein
MAKHRGPDEPLEGEDPSPEPLTFEQAARQIAYNAFHYGIRSVGGINPGTASRREQRRFIAACHKGYARAQDGLVERLLELEQAESKLKVLIKDARRERRKDDARQMERALASIEHQDAVFRSIANGIAWTLLGARRWVIRRLVLNENPTPLASSNLKMGLEFVRSVNKNPQDFALLTDITSCIHVGDALVIQHDGQAPGLRFVELKEGEKNRIVLEFLESWGKTKCERALAIFATEQGEEMFKQADRMVRQHTRASQVMEILDTDRGTDPVTGAEVRIRGPEMEEDDYDEVFPKAIAEARKSGEHVFVVDQCLWVGVYDRDQIGHPMLSFKHHLHHVLLNQEECFLPENPSGEVMSQLHAENVVPYPILSLASMAHVATATPIFIRPFALDDQVDIVTGAITVLVYIDWDTFFAQASKADFEARWETKRERGRSQQRNGMTRRSGRGYFSTSGLPVFSRDGRSITIDGGVVVRMMDGVRPRSILELIEAMWGQAGEIVKERQSNSEESRRDMGHIPTSSSANDRQLDSWRPA